MVKILNYCQFFFLVSYLVLSSHISMYPDKSRWSLISFISGIEAQRVVLETWKIDKIDLIITFSIANFHL